MDTIALRQKVLDLAIRGKLVPQDPNDEPASVLLERIRAQKQQMVREGKLKAKDIKGDTVIFVGEDNLHYEKHADGTVKSIEDEIPFEQAAEIGTKKVIQEHSTIGILVTTDGSITDIPREDYVEAEERVVRELKELNKPFIILLNSDSPYSESTKNLAQKLEDKYQTTVVPTDCSNLELDDINHIIHDDLTQKDIKKYSAILESYK